MRDLAARYQVDIAAFCKNLCMSWEELRESPRDPLVTIGAHTVNHPMLAKLPADAVRSEMEMSRSVIEAALGVRPQHLCYPFGDPSSAGPREFAIACRAWLQDRGDDAARRAVPRARKHLTALPRISLNGEYQRLRYLRVLMSGSATAMWNGLRGLEAA